jgi:hypothetical protein
MSQEHAMHDIAIYTAAVTGQIDVRGLGST